MLREKICPVLLRREMPRVIDTFKTGRKNEEKLENATLQGRVREEM